MDKSITETLKKINRELRGANFLSIFLTFILISSFIIYKIYSSMNLVEAKEINYIASNFSSENTNKNLHFIYASRRGKKYYYFNCKANIKEENKIYFTNDENAQKAGYTLSKTCK